MPGLSANGEAPSRRFRWLKGTLRIAISAVLLVWMVRSANLREIGAALAGISVGFLALANTLQLVGMGIAALRWGGLLRSQGVRIPTGTLVQSCFVASFFRQILPSTIGGDVIRAYDSWRGGASRGVAVATIAVDRLLGLVILALLAIIAFAFSADLGAQIPGLHLWLGLGLAGLSAGAWALFFLPKPLVTWAERSLACLPAAAARPLCKAMNAALIFRGKHAALVRALVLSVLLQLNVVAFYWLIGLALGLPVPAADYLLIVPIATFVMMVPISINGIGVREGIFALLLGAYGVEPATAVAFAWLEYASFLLYGVIGGIVYAARADHPPSPMAAAVAGEPLRTQFPPNTAEEPAAA